MIKNFTELFNEDNALLYSSNEDMSVTLPSLISRVSLQVIISSFAQKLALAQKV
jgi:hypothetical protein